MGPKDDDVDAPRFNESNSSRNMHTGSNKRESLNKEEKCKFKFSEIPVSKLATYSKYTDTFIKD